MMKKMVLAAAAAAALVVPQSSALAALHPSKLVYDVHAPASIPSCVFFKLEGVDVADAGVSGSPYFALSRSHPQFNETFAILLSASAGKRLTNVLTEGSVCGYASLTSIALL